MSAGMRVSLLVLAVLLIGSVGFSQESFAITEDEIKERLKKIDSSTKPTFGLSHENNKKIVDYGFAFNNKTFTITDNFHTPFPEQSVTIGEVNFFEAKVLSIHGLKVQEFIFGIPNKGEAHLGELAIEVWYDVFGEINDVKVVQKSNVIEINTVEATFEKTNCNSDDFDQSCILTNLSMVFLEPLEHKVMAIKAIDNMNRYQITYLNEGFDVSGDSLNPMASVMIPSPIRDEGLILVTQTEKYSSNWVTEDGRIFEKNEFGSFKQINHEFKRFQDSGEAKNRNHSSFGGVLAYEQERATQVFNSTNYISELPESFAITFKQNPERFTPELKAKMLEQEKECLEHLKESTKQARW